MKSIPDEYIKDKQMYIYCREMSYKTTSLFVCLTYNKLQTFSLSMQL